MAVLLVGVIIIAAGVGYLDGAGNQKTSTTTLETTQTFVSQTTSTFSTTLTMTSTSTVTTTLQGPNTGQLGPWIRTTSYPLFPASLGCVANVGYMYCVGGYNGTTPTNGQGELNRTYYAPLSSTGVGNWTRTTDYPIGIQDESCVTSSSYIYCVGGVSKVSKGGDPLGRVSDAYYAPLSSSGIGAWSRTTPFPYVAASPRCMSDSAYVYCLEGDFNGTVYTNAFKAFYAPLSAGGVGNWTESAGLPSSTAGCSAVSGYAYCFGGGQCPPLPGDCYSRSYFAPLSQNGLGVWNRTIELPTAGYATFVTAGPYIYYLSIPVFFSFVSANGTGSWQTTTNYPGSMSGETCVSSGGFIYCVSAGANDVYFTRVGATNPFALQLQNPPPFPRANYLAPAWSGTGGCSVTVNGTFAGAPCFDSNIDNAVVFNCATAASTSSGCKTTVISPANTSFNYDITIWYPLTNTGLPDVNCAYLPSLGYKTPANAWCISIGQNSFIVAQQIEMRPSPP